MIASSLQAYCRLINNACWNQLSFSENLISIAQKSLMQISVQTKIPNWKLLKNVIVIMDISQMVSSSLILSTETESGSWSDPPRIVRLGSWYQDHWNSQKRDCTYIDMVSCGNSIVQNFLFGRNEAIEHMCPPSCETDSFFVDSVMVNSLAQIHFYCFAILYGEG